MERRIISPSLLVISRLPENWGGHAQTTHWPTNDIHADSVLASAASEIGEEDYMVGGDFLKVAAANTLVCGHM